MGIFGVNMPTLYGEGENAFIRLQQEILRMSDDHTIFAWKGDKCDRGLLANSPADFADSGDVLYLDNAQTSPYSLTNIGLRIELPLIALPDASDMFLAMLNCRIRDWDGPLAIYVKRESGEQYVRVQSTNVVIEHKTSLSKSKPRVLYIKEKAPSKFDVEEWMRPEDQYRFLIKTYPSGEHGFSLLELGPPRFWEERKEGPLLKVWSGTSGSLMFQNTSGEKFVVMLGVHNYNVWSDVVTNFGNETSEDVRDSYYEGPGRGDMLWKNLDRITQPLLAGKAVSVSIRKGVVLGQRQYLVEIAVHTKVPPKLDSRTSLQPRPQYIFLVMIGKVLKNGFVVSEFHPAESWEVQDENLLVLSINRSGTSGVIIFHDKSGEQVAVSLGINNNTTWSDFVTDFGKETAKAINDSYYRDGGRVGKAWEFLTDTYAPLKAGRSIHVSTKRFLGDIGFRTEITMESKEISSLCENCGHVALLNRDSSH